MSARAAALPIALAALLAALLAVSSAVAAEAPRWDIVSTTSPTNLQPNSPRNEVQDVSVDATAGTFELGVASVQCEEGAPQFTSPIAFDAPAEEVQTALEALSCDVGAGGVSVSGGPGGTSPYVVTFQGERSNERISPMTVNSSSLSGGAARATVSEAVQGAFVPYLTVTAINVGGAATDGSTITLDDALPPSLSARSITGYDAYASALAENGEGGAPMTCSTPPTISCSYTGIVDPGDMLVMRIPLDVTEPGPIDVGQVSIAGGGASEASLSTPISISDSPASFGPAPASVVATTSTDQAGAHANVTTAFTLATSETDAVPSNVKDVRFDLPPGLVGDTVGMAQCTMGRVLALEHEPNGCPSDTMVGTATVTINTQGGAGGGDGTRVVPIYNIAPATGEPAAFAFDAIKLPVRLDTSVLSDGDYGVRVTAPSLTEAASSLGAVVTIWGVPADHSGPGQDKSLFTLFGAPSFGAPNPNQTRTPLLSNPQQCGEPLSAVMSADSWTSPGAFVSSGPVPMGTLSGCDRLSFESSYSLLPDTLQAGVPAGYSFNLQVPQQREPDGLATPNVKSLKLTLPLGTVVSPSAASGLQTCSSDQFFGGERGESESARLGNCPADAQVGSVEVKTPALPLPLTGQLYLAEPECDPCTPQDAQDGKMIRLYMQIADEGEAPIVVKLEGRGLLDQQSGQVTATFENDPQLPFSELTVRLGGGPRATLANPRVCGPVSTSLDLTPWSTPFTPDSTPSYGFEVNSGCFGPQFNPSLIAGVTNIQAGGYSPFTVAFARHDQDQFLGSLRLQLPPGLLAKLADVPLCPEPRASEGTCGQDSLIGHAQALVGPGSEPFLQSGGQVFLTGGYKGAPFGLSVLVPATAGPYTLAGTSGRGTVVVRAAIGVDPNTSAVIVTADPLPTALDGIPLQLQAVSVTIDRPSFMFNPTNCGKLAIQGTLVSSAGMSVASATPFQVANCAALAFRPRFTAVTQAKTSKAGGASLHVSVSSGVGKANIGKVSVNLPKQLPSRLTTLQKACTDTVFNANPAMCPAASIVGSAKALTPVLKNPLSGPAYLVSHGGVAFPDLVVVLQGEGVTIYLDGATHIKKGITTSTFNSVPDAPIDKFDLMLPEGPHSVLSANLPAKARLSMCGQRLAMPTAITAQNGAVVKQTTKVAVSGCPKRKPKKTTKAKHKKRGVVRKVAAKKR